jgi:hypothetical protein
MYGDGIHLTDAEHGALFELRPGAIGMWAWTQSEGDDAFLALDVNGNGTIDDGSELFGDGSIQVSSVGANGFAALAYYDLGSQGGNDDGVIDVRDAVWPRLRLWTDTDHDGFSTPDELRSVSTSGIHTFSLNAVPSTHVDQYGNEFRYVSTIIADAPVSRVVSDVWLQQAPVRDTDTTWWRCSAWTYAMNYAGPVHTPCSYGITMNDPLWPAADGQYARLVRRPARRQSHYEAIQYAMDHVSIAIGAESGELGCYSVAPPTPDIEFEPFDVEGPVRVKCKSEVVHTGGGGCFR